MKVELSRPDHIDRAAEAAGRAASAAHLTIAEIDDLGGLQEAARLFDVVWSSPGEAPLISASTLRALAYSGNYVAAAFRDAALVGALVGFLGLHRGALQLHSHILGVAPHEQDRNIGYALKLHQRAWALARDIATVTWTFDPLVRRNAYFNLAKLGASITTYYENFYGDMSDGVNVGDESDRVLVEWTLASPAVEELIHVRRLEPDVDILRKEGAVVALESDANGAPLGADVPSSGTLLIQVPDDIVRMRELDRSLAVSWRRAARETLGAALTNGYVASGMTRSGWYVLTERNR